MVLTSVVEKFNRDLLVDVVLDNWAKDCWEQCSLGDFVELVPSFGNPSHLVRVTGFGLAEDGADQLLDLMAMYADTHAGWTTAWVDRQR